MTNHCFLLLLTFSILLCTSSLVITNQPPEFVEQGSDVIIRWASVNSINSVSITLYQNGNSITSIADTPDPASQYLWDVGDHAPTGHRYSILVSAGTSNGTEKVFTDEFSIFEKRKEIVHINWVIVVGSISLLIICFIGVFGYCYQKKKDNSYIHSSPLSPLAPSAPSPPSYTYNFKANREYSV